MFTPKIMMTDVVVTYFKGLF